MSYPAAEGSPLPAWKGYQSAYVALPPSSLAFAPAVLTTTLLHPASTDSFFFLMASMLLAIVLVLAFFKDPVEAKAEGEGVPVEDLKAQRPPVAIV